MNHMNFIEIRHLKLVKTIEKAGNITKAASMLNLTQPALSHQLSDIEEKLKTPLFHRANKKMLITPAGEKLLSASDIILEEIRRVELEIGKLVHGEEGLLRIGTTCILSYKWLPSVMKKLQELYPKVDIEFKTALDVTDALRNRQLDLVITTIVDNDERFEFKTLFSDEIVVVMPPRDPLALKPFLMPQDFEGTNLISYAEAEKGDFYHDYLKPAGIEPAKLIKAEQPEAALELVRSGFGISFFPRWAVQTQLDSGVIFARSFTKKGVFFEWKAITLKNSAMPIFQQDFIRLILESRIQNQKKSH
jgi:LysR family transcriptional regulator for metE and metH